MIQPGPIVFPPPSPTVTDVSCFGGNNGQISLLIIGGTPPYSLSWTGGASSNPATGLSAGTYTCTVTDFNGCTQTSNPITVSQPTLALTAPIPTTTVVSCFGGNDGTATVNPIGGTSPYTYAWSDGQTSQTATALSAGTYFCTVTDANGCTFVSATVNVTEPLLPLGATSSQTNVNCNGGSDGTATVNPVGGTAPYSWLWSIGSQTTQTATSLPAGTYNCVVTDANLCTFTQSVTITQPVAALLATAVITSNYNGQDISCNGANDGIAEAFGTDGTPPYSVVWSNSTTSLIATSLSSGTYTATITDDNGCTQVSNPITLNDPPALTGTITTTDASCNNLNDGTATANPVGGTPGYTYSWSNSATTQTATSLLAGPYTCTVTDANGCPFNIPAATVSQPTSLTLSVGSLSNVSCFGGSDGSATVVPSGGTAPYTYLWQNGQNTQTVTGLSNNTTTGYSCTVTDANGCTESVTVFISEPSAALDAASTSSIVSCFGGNDGTATVVPTGGTGPYTYLWSDGQITGQATTLSAGTFTCTVTDANGCTFPVSVTVNEPPVALTNNPTTITDVQCFGQSNGGATVFPTGGVPPYNFSWTGPFPSTTIIGSTSSISNVVSGVYVCNVTDGAGCLLPIQVTINEPTQIGFSLPIVFNNPSCPNTNTGDATVVPIGGVGGFTYLWSGGAANGQISATASALPAGTYTCTVTDANGCSPASATIPVTLVDPPSINVSVFPVPVSCNGGATGSISISVSGGTQFSLPSEPYHYLWSNSTTTSTNSSLIAGTYNCQITDANGCVANTGAIVITEPSTSLSASIINIVDESCAGLDDGSLEVVAVGGTLTYNYLGQMVRVVP